MTFSVTCGAQKKAKGTTLSQTMNESSFTMAASDTPAQTVSFLLGALSELVEVTNSVKVCFG